MLDNEPTETPDDFKWRHIDGTAFAKAAILPLAIVLAARIWFPAWVVWVLLVPNLGFCWLVGKSTYDRYNADQIRTELGEWS